MLADLILPNLSKCISMNFPEINWDHLFLPKREELSFLTVLALPKASKIGLESKTLSSIPLESSTFSGWC